MEQVFRDWRQVRGSLQTNTLLTGLLAFRLAGCAFAGWESNPLVDRDERFHTSG